MKKILNFFKINVNRLFQKRPSQFENSNLNTTKESQNFSSNKNYEAILLYFNKYSFGSQLPVLSILSSLPPVDRCVIIEQILVKDKSNIEAYSKLSLAYLKKGDKKKAYDLLSNANKYGNISNINYKILNNNLIEIDKSYNGNFGSAQSYDQVISILENRVTSEMKNEYHEFYNLIYTFAQENLSPNLSNIIEELFNQPKEKDESDLFDRINKSGFSFTPSKYEIWMKGKCIKSGNTSGKIVAEVMKLETTKSAIIQIRVSDETLQNDIKLLNDFDIFFKSNGRYMLATIPSNKAENECIGLSNLRLIKGSTRNQKIFNKIEPFGCSIFPSNDKISKVSFAFNNPEKLIEFNK